jgi:hypothetical protein
MKAQGAEWDIRLVTTSQTVQIIAPGQLMPRPSPCPFKHVGKKKKRKKKYKGLASRVMATGPMHDT